MKSDVNIDEILSKFGNASYCKEFWESCNKRIKEEQKQFEQEEIDSRPDLLTMKTKVFGRLIGD